MVLILVSQRAEDGGPVLSEDERLQHSAACRMIVGEEDKGAGTLFVTTECVVLRRGPRVAHGAVSRALPHRLSGAAWGVLCVHRLVVWLNADAASASYALTYPSLNLFAVSRDPATFANKCIYCQVRTTRALPRATRVPARTHGCSRMPPSGARVRVRGRSWRTRMTTVTSRRRCGLCLTTRSSVRVGVLQAGGCSRREGAAHPQRVCTVAQPTPRAAHPTPHRVSRSVAAVRRHDRLRGAAP